MPARERFDALASPDEFPWDVIRPGAALGLKTLPLTAELGGRDADMVTLCLVAEELAAGDLGACYFFRHYWRFARVIPRLTPRLRDWLVERMHGDERFCPASAMTEEAAGSDNALPYDAPGHGALLEARREGDEWVLNGSKMMTTNGGLAGVYFVHGRTDPDAGIGDGLTLFVIPADTPGFSTGPWYSKIGQRGSPQADLQLENVRLTDDHVVGEVGRSMAGHQQVLIGPNVTNAASALGVARAAYEHALDFSLDRVQGGQPIYRHQLVAHELGSLKAQLDAARSHVYRVAWELSHDRERFEPELAWGVRVVVTELAIDLTRRVMSLFGGRGVMSAWPVEKLHRDALTLTHGNGTNALMLLRTGTRQAEKRLAARAATDDERGRA